MSTLKISFKVQFNTVNIVLLNAILEIQVRNTNYLKQIVLLIDGKLYSLYKDITMQSYKKLKIKYTFTSHYLS